MRPEIPKNRPLSFKGRRNSNGITLIEVIATMTFLSIGLLGLVSMAMTAAPTVVSIHSRGNPAGTNSQRVIILDVKIYGDDIIYGALNNSS
jgi:Flp pilus assembly protein CpaB